MWPGRRGDEEKEVSNQLEIGWKAINRSPNDVQINQRNRSQSEDSDSLLLCSAAVT